MGGVVFDDKMWVMGGYSYSSGSAKFFNDVWCSGDGITWTQVTASAPWKKRDRTNSVVYDNKIWIIGGTYPEYVALNDVWYSSDGKEWKCATQGCVIRQYTQTVVFKNKICILGGFNEDHFFSNDVWSSTDGGKWIKEASPPWSKRAQHGAVVFNDKLWVAGGNQYDGYYLNDVWYCESATGIDKKAISQPTMAPVIIHSVRPNSPGVPVMIHYTLKQAGAVSISITDCSGREILGLWSGVQNAGTYEMKWDGRTAGSGARVVAGAYFMRFKTGEWETSRKIVVCR